jgi:hypothetical protein
MHGPAVALIADRDTAVRADHRSSLRAVCVGTVRLLATDAVWEDLGPRIIAAVREIIGPDTATIAAAQLVRGDRIFFGPDKIETVTSVTVNLATSCVHVLHSAGDVTMSLSAPVRVLIPRPTVVPADDPFGEPNSPLTAQHLRSFGHTESED